MNISETSGNRVAVVIVTYGDRSLFFNQVLKKLNELKPIKHIVLVDNLVKGQSVKDVEKLKKKLDKLIVIKQGFNSGSAKGFKDGIARANEFNIDFIWLLDDDNLPQDDALDNLLLKVNTIGLIKEKKYALLSYRPDREIYKKAIEDKKPSAMLGPINSFLGFHIVSKLKNKLNKKSKKPEDSKTVGLVSVAPYGGLFFHKSLIDDIGLPNEDYYLYGDDFDYSYRITKSCGGIYLVIDSVVNDLEQSFHLKKENEGILSNRLIKTNSKDRIFYSVRNGIVFEQNFVSNKLLYIINAILHISLTFIILILNPKHLWKYKYYIKGIKASI